MILSAPLNIVNSAALRHVVSATLSNYGMRTIEEIRRLRLKQLAEEFGSYAELNAKLGNDRRDSSLSQIANQSSNSKGGSPKSMGSPTARSLERVCSKPRGWMDNDPSLGAAAAPSLPPSMPPPDFHEIRAPSRSEWQVLRDLEVYPQEERDKVIAELHATAERWRAIEHELTARAKAKAKGNT